MAEKRMFSKQIIDSDVFLDMSLSTQALYFHLCMRADDDGFINNPKRIQRLIGSSDDELKLLIAKKFVIPFESGVCVIKHWKIHNYIQKDRYKPTAYQEEKSQLSLKENKSYSLVDTTCIQPVYNSCTSCTPRLDKNRLDKNRLDKNREEENGNSGRSGEDILSIATKRNFILSPIQIEQLLEDVAVFSFTEVEKALEIADNNGKRNYSYVKGVLQKRRVEGDSRKKAEDEIKERLARGEDPF